MDALKDILARNEIRVDMKSLDGQLKTLEAERQEALTKLQQADRADSQARQKPAEQAFAKDAQSAAQEVRQERREATQDAQQKAWREDVAARAPKPGKGRAAAADSGIKVVNGATGAVLGLGSFILSIFDGSSSPAGKGEPDMKAFVTDPEARKRQQLERLEAKRAAAADLKARERMDEDLRAGRNLRAEDIMHLSHEHKLAISQRGDDAVRDMVEEVRRFSDRHWKGEERERDR